MTLPWHSKPLRPRRHVKLSRSVCTPRNGSPPGPIARVSRYAPAPARNTSGCLAQPDRYSIGRQHPSTKYVPMQCASGDLNYSQPARPQPPRAYDLMKSILKTAVEDGLISANPCKIKGGSLTTTGKSTTPPTEVELDIVIEKIVPKYKPFVIIAAAGGLRGHWARWRR